MTPKQHARHASASCDHLSRGICKKCCAHSIHAALQEEREATMKKLQGATKHFMGEYGEWDAGMDILQEILLAQKKKMRKNHE